MSWFGKSTGGSPSVMSLDQIFKLITLERQSCLYAERTYNFNSARSARDRIDQLLDELLDRGYGRTPTHIK